MGDGDEASVSGFAKRTEGLPEKKFDSIRNGCDACLRRRWDFEFHRLGNRRFVFTVKSHRLRGPKSISLSKTSRNL